MSVTQVERDRREMLIGMAQAITALSTAGSAIIAIRQYLPAGQAQDLVTAIRDGVTELIADVETLREVATGRT